MSRPWDRDSALLQTLIEAYYLKTGEIPSTSQGLQSLIVRPENFPDDKEWVQMLKSPMTDPWGNPYMYRRVADDSLEFEIRGLGPDGVVSKDDHVAMFEIGNRTQ